MKFFKASTNVFSLLSIQIVNAVNDQQNINHKSINDKTSLIKIQYFGNLLDGFNQSQYQYFNNCIDMKFSKAPGLPFFTSTYVFVNILLLISYPFMRLFTSVGNRDLRNLDSFGFTYQNSIIYSGLAFIGVYYLRSASLRQFLLDCLSIGKIIIISLLFFAKIHYCLYYIIVCAATWLVIPYPRYNAPNKFIKIQSYEQFDELVGQLKPKVQQDMQSHQTYHYKNKKMFFIEFYVDWVYSCNTSKQLWYQYSYRYSTPQLKFLQVNINRFPDLAKKFNINVSGFSKQLPTIVVLQDGAESARFPPIKQNNKVDRVIKLDYKILLKYFDLEGRYLQTRQKRKIKSE